MGLSEALEEKLFSTLYSISPEKADDLKTDMRLICSWHLIPSDATNPHLQVLDVQSCTHVADACLYSLLLLP
jgi:hypothetical protein